MMLKLDYIIENSQAESSAIDYQSRDDIEDSKGLIDHSLPTYIDTSHETPLKSTLSYRAVGHVR